MNVSSATDGETSAQSRSQPDLSQACSRAATLAERVRSAVRSVFVAPDETIDRATVALFSGLHLLVEDIPGVGKTTLARALAEATGMDFGRIQCTPDLLPGDVTGMYIWDSGRKEFRFRPGAVMHQFLLADELNRASTRTQAALLEAMQEGSVTVDDRTHELPDPFFVIATENPQTFAGTFGLPEAQLDRFGMRISLGYPSGDHEREILAESPVSRRTALTPVCGPEDVVAVRRASERVHVSEQLIDYLIAVASRTRRASRLRLGASPRAIMHLQHAARARALLSGRDYVEPEDIRELVEPVLVHRLQLSAEARMEQKSAAAVLAEILSRMPMPAGTV